MRIDHAAKVLDKTADSTYIVEKREACKLAAITLIRIADALQVDTGADTNSLATRAQNMRDGLRLIIKECGAVSTELRDDTGMPSGTLARIAHISKLLLGEVA